MLAMLLVISALAICALTLLFAQIHRTNGDERLFNIAVILLLPVGITLVALVFTFAVIAGIAGKVLRNFRKKH